jgi:hypothetical protein
MTYYEFLGISRSATHTEIRDAYKNMAMHVHPDRIGGDGALMKVLNSVYAVLSDPLKKAKYDATLEPRQNPPAQPRPPEATPRPQPVRKSMDEAELADKIIRYGRRTLGIACLGMCVFMVISSIFNLKQLSKNQVYQGGPPKPSSGKIHTSPSHAPPARPVPPPRTVWLRPRSTPEGKPWPSQASALGIQDTRSEGGLCSVTIDNSRNSSDVYLKLFLLTGAAKADVRRCFIPAKGKFIFEKVATGRYDVRYQDLTDGGFSKTEAFSLTQTTTSYGTTYSVLSLTLYKVSNGNMETTNISESEFTP